MRNRMNNVRGVALVAGLCAAWPAAAQVTYTDRATFEAAASATSTTTFDGFASDTPFRGSALDVGAFSVVTMGSAADGGSFPENNIVDVPPVLPETDINGTAHLNIFTNADSSFFLTLDAPATAFGADFGAFNDGAFRTALFVDGVQLGANWVNGDGFFGFTTNTPFTTLEFRGIINDVFGIDNVTIGTGAAVPEPSTWAMMLMGFGAIGWSMRRRTSALKATQELA
jgi:PEP-CTERM motif-containing protein